MNVVLNVLCNLEDHVEMSDEEQDAYNIAVQCVTTVLNRMVNDRPIAWDDEDD